jgi:hypothetical protein
LGASLLQAFYLSHKNHGQFLLDHIKHQARTTPAKDRDGVFQNPDTVDSAKKAIEDFTSALDRDPSDAELWRRTARVAAFLKSNRISRYSLEAAIELDDDPAVVDVEPPSLAEGFAGEQLRRQLTVLEDRVALTHPIMKPFTTKDVPDMLQPYIDPIPFLPDSTTRLATSKADVALEAHPVSISIKSMSWTELGTELLFFLAENGPSGEGISIELPDISDDEQAVQMEIDRQLQAAEDTVSGNAATEVVKEQEPAVVEPSVSPKVPRKDRAMSLPSRKRSQSEAGMAEPAGEENAETKRSKRTRRRETAMEETIDPATLLATQLQQYQAADQNLFQTLKNILENLDVTDLGTLNHINEILDTCTSDDRTAKITTPATVDLRDSIISYKEDSAKVFLDREKAAQPGLSTFHEHTKSGSQRTIDPPAFEESHNLRSFARRVNAEWLTIQDVAYEWVRAVVETYHKFKWSDRTKTAVVHVISRFDETLYERLCFELGRKDALASDTALELDAMVQTLFELHLDVYERITNPNSVVEQAIRIETKGRLDRWFDVATYVRRLSPDGPQDLCLRFLWASVFTTTLADEVTRDHILTLWHGLREYLSETSHADINLPNNVAMPEISAAAADREISKLTTMDFFLNLFQDEMGDPVGVIDTLEPVMNPESVVVETAAAVTPEANGDTSDPDRQQHGKQPISEIANQGLRDLWKFLANSTTDLRLFLWTRLAEAYAKIKYTTKQFSCYLRAIEMIVADLEQDAYINTPSESRRTLFLTMLKSADDLMVQALSLALNDNSSFDIIDDGHIRSTAAALAKLNCTLHVASMIDDEVSIGMTQPPAKSAAFSAFCSKLREMQVRTWSLQYTVLKVGISQNLAMFIRPENDLADFLAAVHQVLGLRKCCKASNKVFLKMMRIELLKQRSIENWEDYLGQVLYDLHGLKLGVGIWEVQEHGCPPEKLEKRQAMALAEKVTTLANRMSLKDLLKSDLKNVIDHMQQAIGTPKSTPQMLHNLRNFTEYTKRPIHPLRLYQAMTGKVSLDAVSVNVPESALAEHGWFFLQGMIAFTKFKGVDLNRRQTPGAVDDLRIATTFLRLQLQFTPDHWNAWFRLAECFDYELEEAVLWTAEKMNKDNRDELVKYQRNSIHCYTLALSYSRSWEEDSLAAISSEVEDQVLSEMYYSFGMRLYASSREPFAMEPFKHSDHERFFINPEAQADPGAGPGTFRKILHKEMTDYKVWKFASSLFKRAMAAKPRDWKVPYMYAKCLWKMFQKPVQDLDAKDHGSKPTVDEVVDALERTVEVVVAQQKPRQDPILEPHYKILSTIHKLVMRGDLDKQEAATILQRQPFAPKGSDDVSIEDMDDWEAYVLKSLRVLRDKDKSNWQHRLVMRHATILFDYEPPNRSDDNDSAEAEHEQDVKNLVSGKAAFSVLRENMFTKTMVMNVWKCEAERPGRHHVYMSKYVRYVFRLLSVMNDRTDMEALLRRLRKKAADFYRFNDLWNHCAVTYMRLIRHSYQVPADVDAFKNLSPDEFEIVADRIKEWVTEPAAQDHRALNALKDAIELKKLNAALLKSPLFDDLITDCYSYLYMDIGSTLPGEVPAKIIEDRQKARDAELMEKLGEVKPALLTDGLLRPSEPDKDMTPLGSVRASAEPLEKHEGAPRRRTATVRKPEIIRKAEQAVTRALEGPQPKSVGANGANNKTRRGSKNITPTEEADDANTSSDEGESEGEEAADGHAGDEDVEMVDADASGAGDAIEGGQDRGVSASSSPPGSVHDSADDESDLSDVPPDYEDDAPPELLFPTLRESVGIQAHDSEDDSSVGDEEDEVDDHEMEGEEGEEEEEEEEGAPDAEA